MTWICFFIDSLDSACYANYFKKFKIFSSIEKSWTHYGWNKLVLGQKKILVLPVTVFKKIGSVGREKFFLEDIFILSVELRASKSVYHTFFNYLILHCYTKTKNRWVDDMKMLHEMWNASFSCASIALNYILNSTLLEIAYLFIYLLFESDHIDPYKNRT